MRQSPRLLVGVALLALLAWAAIPRFVHGRGPEPAVIATMRRLARTTRPAPGAPIVETPDGDRHAYRVQAAADGVRVHAWPLRFDPAAPHLYFLDVDGSCWICRNPSGSCVGLARPPPLDDGAGPLLDLEPGSPSADHTRKGPTGRLWCLEHPRR
jgi:hypothetical protein